MALGPVIAVSLSDPQWWIAIGTCALAILTLILALVGAFTVRAAYMQAQLDNEPRLLLRSFQSKRIPLGATVGLLYEICEKDGAAVFSQRFTLELLTGGEYEPSRKDDDSQIFVEITNTGRSPVFDVRLNCGIRIMHGTAVDGETGEPVDIPDTEGAAEIVISALPEALPIYVGFSIKDGFAVVDPLNEARAKRWRRPFFAWWAKPRFEDVTVVASASGNFAVSG